MTVSRRNVLLQGGVIGAGVIASQIPGIVALAQAQTPPLRRSLQGLAWNDPIVAAYRDGVGIMKQKPDSDKVSWISLAKIHGLDPNTYHFCPHGNWYFLPWHRAYVVTLERIIRELTSHKDFAMPYWDWTTNPKMPDVFLNPTTPDGKTNWLDVTDPGFKRTWPPNKPMPASIVGPTVLKKILKAPTYEQFGTSRPQGQNSLDPSWIVDQDSGVQGVLEATPHNNVHNNIGGWMPTAISARDPIFFMHHTNIDRIWALWNLHHKNSDEHFWKDMPFTNNFIHPDGTPWSMKVSDLFVPETLGYTYGLKPPAGPAGAAPQVMALDTQVKALFATAGANAAGTKTYTASNTQAATPTKALDIAVTVDPGSLAAVAHRPPTISGLEETDFAQAQIDAASGPRVLAFIRDVKTTNASDTQFRVFLDAEGLGQDTSTNSPNYVGTFGILEHSSHAQKHGTPSFVVDLTDAIQGVYGTATTLPNQIKLQILPVSNTGAVDKAGTATPGKVEIAFLSS